MNAIKYIVRRIRLGNNWHRLGSPGSGWECCDGYYGEAPTCDWGK
jgi:hypothetical protein